MFFAAFIFKNTVNFQTEKLWSAKKEIIHFFAHFPEGGKPGKIALCKRITFVENFGAVKKSMRKNGIFYVEFRYNSTFFHSFYHMRKTSKTLDTARFFEFFTKFSTPCGKLSLQVEKFFRFFVFTKYAKKRSALKTDYQLFLAYKKKLQKE